MRRRSLYRVLALLSLASSAAALVLAIAALLLAHPFEAGAAALCAAVLFLPGLLFLGYARRLLARDLALAHAAAVAEAEGVTDGSALAEKLKVPKEDADKILRTAVREGHAHGQIDDRGRFIAAAAPRCASCGKPVPARSHGGPCPSCGAPLDGGA